ncbi:hypothetical protein [Streptomyces sp. AC555_RSS877]|nr:hypothetical protein [Streptomyces sp. AC555_RSS877]
MALVRRKLPTGDTYARGIDPGTGAFKGTGRPDTKSRAADIG